MAINEIGQRFSEDVYSSREEIKALYNTDNISSVWEKVLDYRSYYDENLSLVDKEGNPFKLCLTKSLLKKTFGLEFSLMQDEIILNQLSKENQGAFLLKKRISLLKVLARYLQVKLTDSTALKLVSGTLENVPNQYLTLKSYLSALEYSLSLQTLNLQKVETINNLLLLKDKKEKASYRKESKNDLNSLALIDRKDIPAQFEKLFTFLSQNEIPSFLKATSILYFFLSVQPFEYDNELTASVVAKTFLRENLNSNVTFYTDFESVVFSTSDSFLHRLSLVEETLDMTYFTSPLLPYFESLEKDDKELLQDYLQHNNVPTQSKSLPKMGEEIPFEESPLFALPAFPKEDKNLDFEALTVKLLEVHPQLKRKQAHFYVSHCTIGLTYTIEQFKESEKTVYETARTSMEDLAKRGFYEKKIVGKKFVYAPIPQKEMK